MTDARFVGRADELDLLATELAWASQGRPRVVLIDGDAGVGKTRLVGEFLDRSAHVAVLRAVGDETQTASSYGLVRQLVPLLRTGESQSRDGVTDPFRVGAELVTALGDGHGDRPLCLVIDDAHDGDQASLHALLFTIRRLQQDRVLAIVISRAGTERVPTGFGQLATITGQHLELGGLPLGDFRTMLLSIRPQLDSALVERLWAHTDGNPLHAWGLLDEVATDELGRGHDPMPAPASFARGLARRLDACAFATQGVLGAAAVLGAAPSLAAVTRIVDVVDPVGAVREAIAAGILDPISLSEPTDVHFAHRLIRSTIYHRLPVDDRVRLHTLAAGVAASEHESLRHRAAAASTTDRTLADDLATCAEDHYRRRDFAAAAAFFQDAARFSPDDRVATERMWRTADCWLEAGDVRQARLLAETTPADGGAPWRTYTLGRLALATGRFDEARRWLDAVWEETSRDADVHWRLRRSAATELGHMCIVEGRASDALRWGRRAVLADPGLSSLDDDVVGIVTAAHGIAGRTEEALAGVAWIDAAGGIHPSSIDPACIRGGVRMYGDDLEGARADLTAVVEASRRHGPYQRTVIAHGHLADVEYRSGRWDRALFHAEHAISLAIDTEQFWLLAFLHANASMPLARRGEWETAERHVEQSAECAGLTGHPAALNYASTAAAMLAVSRGEPERAVEATDAISSWHDIDGVLEPGMLPWPELRAEALVRVGRLDAAEALLHQLLERARARRRTSTLAAAHRVWGLLEDARGSPADAEDGFRRAFAYSNRVAMPFERALIQLQYGAHLRRSGQRRHAASHLRDAEAGLAGLGAVPYLEAAAAELAACGLTPTPSPHRSSGVDAPGASGR